MLNEKTSIALNRGDRKSGSDITDNSNDSNGDGPNGPNGKGPNGSGGDGTNGPDGKGPNGSGGNGPNGQAGNNNDPNNPNGPGNNNSGGVNGPNGSGNGSIGAPGNITIWDMGGSTKVRTLWNHYYDEKNAIIYVIDNSNPSSFDLALEWLKKVLNHETTSKLPILILANKQDIEGGSTLFELKEKFGLDELNNRIWTILFCSASTGTGIKEALQWLDSVTN